MKRNWQQMNLLSEPARENVRIEKVETLSNELVAADAAAVNEAIRFHRLNDRETELLIELLEINYISDVTDADINTF